METKSLASLLRPLYGDRQYSEFDRRAGCTLGQEAEACAKRGTTITLEQYLKGQRPPAEAAKP